jgi:hypothetical protein
MKRLTLGTHCCGRSDVGSAALADRCEEGWLVFAHFVDEGLIIGALVSRGPQNHFGENWGEVKSFGGEEVDEFAAIGRIGTGSDDAVGFEATKTVGKDISGGALVGVKEFLKRARAAEHHVSDDEQRPAIAEHFDRGVQRTPGAAFGGRIGFGHVEKLADFTCNTQVMCGRLRRFGKQELENLPQRRGGHRGSEREKNNIGQVL